MYAHICILTANFLCSISGLFSSCCAVHIDVHMYVCMPADLNSLPTSSASISECCSSCCAVHIDVHIYIFTYVCIYACISVFTANFFPLDVSTLLQLSSLCMWTYTYMYLVMLPYVFMYAHICILTANFFSLDVSALMQLSCRFICVFRYVCIHAHMSIQNADFFCLNNWVILQLSCLFICACTYMYVGAYTFTNIDNDCGLGLPQQLNCPATVWPVHMHAYTYLGMYACMHTFVCVHTYLYWLLTSSASRIKLFCSCPWLFFQIVIQAQPRGSKNLIVLYQEMWLQKWRHVSKLPSAGPLQRFNWSGLRPGTSNFL